MGNKTRHGDVTKSARQHVIDGFREGSAVAAALRADAEFLATRIPKALRPLAVQFYEDTAAAIEGKRIEKTAPIRSGELFEMFAAQVRMIEPDEAMVRVDGETREAVREKIHKLKRAIMDCPFEAGIPNIARAYYRFRFPEVVRGAWDQTYSLYLDIDVEFTSPEALFRQALLYELFKATPRDYLQRILQADILGDTNVQYVYDLAREPSFERFVEATTLLEKIGAALWTDERASFLNRVFHYDVQPATLAHALFAWTYIIAAHDLHDDATESDAWPLVSTECLTLTEKLVALDVLKEHGKSVLRPLFRVLMAMGQRESYSVDLGEVIEDAKVKARDEARAMTRSDVAIKAMEP